MRSLIVFLSAVALIVQASAADDSWSKLSDLKSGTELKVYRTGNKPLVLAAFADVNEDNLIVLVKNTETAIPKEEIDRIDARGKAGKPSMSTETHSSDEPPPAGPPNIHQQEGPTNSSSSSVSFGSGKGEFKTVYRRNLSEVKPAAQ